MRTTRARNLPVFLLLPFCQAERPTAAVRHCDKAKRLVDSGLSIGSRSLLLFHGLAHKGYNKLIAYFYF